MTQSINKVILVGNLGKDPEVKTTKDGQKMVKFSLATGESWKDKEGNKKERTEWHNVVVFCDVISEIASHLKKGSPVYIEGRLQNRKWNNDNNIEQTITEVVILKYSGKLIYFNKDSQSYYHTSHTGGQEFKKNTDINDYSFDEIPY